MAVVAKRILVGYDGSTSARRALERAADLAGYGSTITIVTVSEPGANGRDRRLLADAKEQLAARLVPAYALNPEGDAAEQLLEAASALGADVIVVGTRPDGGVSSHLVEEAPCDVLVVR